MEGIQKIEMAEKSDAWVVSGTDTINILTPSIQLQ